MCFDSTAFLVLRQPDISVAYTPLMPVSQSIAPFQPPRPDQMLDLIVRARKIKILTGMWAPLCVRCPIANAMRTD